MIDFGIVLLVIGALLALGCQLGRVPVGVKIGLATAIVGLVLIVLGFVLPALDSPVTVGEDALPVLVA